ncbi:MAG: 50S ribosomal protein L29 [Chloroflexi bacterium]|nr:50S ribosomal protein L29 [Chloroflexota bacterium]
MKREDFSALDELGLERRLAELRAERFNLRFQQATRQLTNTSRLREVRRDIARVLTRQTELEREQGEE